MPHFASGKLYRPATLSGAGFLFLLSGCGSLASSPHYQNLVKSFASLVKTLYTGPSSSFWASFSFSRMGMPWGQCFSHFPHPPLGKGAILRNHQESVLWILSFAGFFSLFVFFCLLRPVRLLSFIASNSSSDEPLADDTQQRTNNPSNDI